MWTEWCGHARLIVSGSGARTKRLTVDTCNLKFINVSLERARSPRPPVDACTRAAYDFVAALARRDREQVQLGLANPERSAEYQNALHQQDLAHWGIDVEASLLGPSCRVTIGLFLVTGCASRWQVDLHERDQRWLVDALVALPVKDLVE
jgi:hypothetical protein